MRTLVCIPACLKDVLAPVCVQPSVMHNCGKPLEFAPASALRDEFREFCRAALTKTRPFCPLDDKEKQGVGNNREEFLHLVHIETRLKKQRALKMPLYYKKHSEWMHDVQVVVQTIVDFWQMKVASGKLEQTITSPVAAELKTAEAKRFVKIAEHYDDSLAVADNTNHNNAKRIVADCNKALAAFMDRMKPYAGSDKYLCK